MATTNKYIYWFFFGLVCACYMFIYTIFPYGLDDWNYIGEINYLGEDENGHHTMWEGIKNTLLKHYETDNARIGNTLGFLFIILPKWLNGSIISICLISYYYLSVKTSQTKPGDIAKLALLTLCIVFGIIWENHMFTHMYAYNYIIISPFFLFSIKHFISQEHRLRLWVSIVLGLLIGSWHESFGITLLAGGGAVLLLKPSLVSKWRVAHLAAAFVGMIWLFTFSAPYKRFGLPNFFHLISYVLISLLILALLIFFARRFKRFLSKFPALVIIFVTAIIILTPLAASTRLFRIEMPVMLLFPCLITSFIPNSPAKRPFYINALSILVLLFISIHLVCVCIDTVKLKRSVDELVTKAFKNRHRTEPIYYSAHLSDNYLPLSFGRPTNDFFEGARYLDVFTNNEHFTIGVPFELMEYKEGLGRQLKSSPEIYIWNGHFISKSLNDKWRGDLWIEYPLWKEKCAIKASTFKGSDGKDYLYIYPVKSIIAYRLGEPDDAYFEN